MSSNIFILNRKTKMKKQIMFCLGIVTGSCYFTPVEGFCIYELGSPTDIPISTASKSLESDILPQIPSSATRIDCYSEALTGTIPELTSYSLLTRL